jgi:hypothetical protein
MKSRSNQKQAGVSLTGLIFLLAILGAIAVLAMKIVPTVTEFMAVKRAIVTAKSAGSTPAEVRASFDKQADVGYIDSISGKDLEIIPQNGVMEISFAYEKRIPLVGPASLLLDYQGSTASKRNAKTKSIE